MSFSTTLCYFVPKLNEE